MLLRVKPTPTRLPTNSLYPDGQHTLAFYIKCVPPVEPAHASLLKNPRVRVSMFSYANELSLDTCGYPDFFTG